MNAWTQAGSTDGSAFAPAIDPMNVESDATPPPSSTPTPPEGRDTWVCTGPGGGLVHSLASAPGRLYAGTENGGIFKSTDGGVGWGAVNQGLPRADVRGIAIDPANPSTVYAGLEGAGVFKSTDAGTEWRGANTGLNSLGVNTLVIDRGMPTTLFAGVQAGGLYKSTDGAATWVRTNAGLPPVDINFLAFDPSTSAILYAATQEAGVFKTTDGGSHWQATGDVPRYVNSLAIDPTAANVIFAATAWGVSKSSDGGITWADASVGIAYSNGTTPVSVLSLLIDPSTPTTLWAGSYTAGVFKTTDGGRSWTAAATAVPDVIYSLVPEPSAHATLYAAGFGVFESMDGGAHWAPTSLPTVARVTALRVHPAQPATLFLAAYGEGIFKSTDDTASWARSGAGLTSAYVNDVQFDPTMPSTMYVSADDGVFRSTDSGASWVATSVRGAAYGLIVVATQPPTVYVACQDNQTSAFDICGSTDGGATWRPGGLDSGGLSRIVVDPQDAAILYIGKAHSYGVKNGGIFKSTDAGAHWRATGLLSFAEVVPLAVDPQASGVVYAAYGGGLLRSTDGGGSWRPVYTGLPGSRVGELLFDPIDPHRLYASAGQLFASADGGGSWTQAGDHLANGITALAIDPVSGTSLYAGTSAGVFVLRGVDFMTPTPTPTPDPRCAPDAINVAPVPALAGFPVTVSGLCYFLHSGHHADVYFDTIHVGAVVGDTVGHYEFQFVVPADTRPGMHRIRVAGAQSVTFEVHAGEVTPTPTPTATDGFCPAQNITVVPSVGPAGIGVVVSGQCYWLHSGRGSDVYFDDVRLGFVRGDTPGNYAGLFIVPDDAAPGAHVIRLGMGVGVEQSATFVVDGSTPLCRGDCDRDGVVSISELVRGVAIALRHLDVSACPALDVNGDGAVTVDEIIGAVARALRVCA